MSAINDVNARRTMLIREICTDNFEGIPCDYPNCTCDPRNKKNMEEEADEQLKGEVK